MKSGIELISLERQEQIEKHGYTVEKDLKRYFNGDLTKIAIILMRPVITSAITQRGRPFGWPRYLWYKILNKPYKERLIIAAALIAAELDMINALEI